MRMVNLPWLVFLIVNTSHSHTEEVDDREHFTLTQFDSDSVKKFTLQPNGSWLLLSVQKCQNHHKF